MIYRLLNFKTKEFLMVILGTGLYSLGIEWFAQPINLVTGGATGLSIVISHAFNVLFNFPISLGTLNILINIPIFIITGKQKGLRFIKKSIVGALLISLWLFVFQFVPNIFEIGDDILIASILTGVFCGVGIGLVLRAGASSGGSDTLANFFHSLFPRFALSTILFAIDATIIIIGLFVFGIIHGVYAIIAVFISSKLIDNLLGGLRFAKAVWIMSSKTEQISQSIINKLGRGNTGISYQGMYTKKEGRMLFVVVWPKELPKLKKIIGEIDPGAFITICPAQEVLGEGFIQGELN